MFEMTLRLNFPADFYEEVKYKNMLYSVTEVFNFS